MNRLPELVHRPKRVIAPRPRRRGYHFMRARLRRIPLIRTTALLANVHGKHQERDGTDNRGPCNDKDPSMRLHFLFWFQAALLWVSFRMGDPSLAQPHRYPALCHTHTTDLDDGLTGASPTLHEPSS
jgi:hypothetical protein